MHCNVRLDPLMTKSEAEWFFDNGCPVCKKNEWQIVVGQINDNRPTLSEPRRAHTFV